MNCPSSGMQLELLGTFQTLTRGTTKFDARFEMMSHALERAVDQILRGG